MTNVFKNGNINTVVRHKLTFVFIWRGGRVGLWHQSWKLACVYSVPWVRIPPSPPTIFDIRPWIYESRFFVLYLFILYYVGVPKWWRGQFAKLLGRVRGAEVRTLSPTPKLRYKRTSFISFLFYLKVYFIDNKIKIKYNFCVIIHNL